MHSKRITAGSWIGRLSRLLTVGGLASLAIHGCSSSDERKRASDLAGDCTLNSDCDPKLICTFERCHKQCTEDRDCLADLRCVKSEESDVFVCQLGDETECNVDKDCPGDQSCGTDEECRDACSEDDDCVGEQVCANSGECASTLPGKDRLDANGNLQADGSPMFGGGGGGGGSNPSDATAGADSGGGGALGTSATSGGGQTSGEAGAASGPETGLDYQETPDGMEDVLNDERENAIPVQTAISIHLGKKAGAVNGVDHDWFSLAVPDDGKAHIIRVNIEQDAGLRTFVAAHAGEDNATIGSTSLSAGVTSYVYVTVGPNTTTLFEFADNISSSTGGMARITFEERAENDPQEPNNDKDGAAAISLGKSVSGQLLNPFISESERPVQDWFAVDLELGAATITLSAAPADGRLGISVQKPMAGTPALLNAPATGGTGSYPYTVTAAGRHYIVIAPYGTNSGVSSYSYNSEPGYLTEPYTISVTQ